MATLDTLGNQTITATDTVTASITGNSNSISVVVGPASHLSVVGPASIVAGTTFNFTVTALDAANDVVTSYSGTVRFTSSDAHAVLPANSMLTNGTGKGTFPATLKTAGGQRITATDTVTASIAGTSNAIGVFAHCSGLGQPCFYSAFPPVAVGLYAREPLGVPYVRRGGLQVLLRRHRTSPRPARCRPRANRTPPRCSATERC